MKIIITAQTILMSMEKPSAHRFYIHFYRVNITENIGRKMKKRKKITKKSIKSVKKIKKWKK